MDTYSFIVHIKTDHIHKDIAEDDETTFDTSNYELDRPLPNGKNKYVIGLRKDDLCGKIMKKFVAQRAKTYSCIIDDASEDKKAKGTKECVIKKLKSENYKNCLEANQPENKTNHLEKNIINTDSFKRIINNS